MSLARVVITAVVVEGRSKSAVAAEYGISRRWVQKLCRRFEEEGEAAFVAQTAYESGSHRGGPRRCDRPAAKGPVREGPRRRGRHHRLPPGRTGPGGAEPVHHLGGCCVGGALSPISPTSDPRAPSSVSAPTSPTRRWQADITHWKLRGGREVADRHVKVEEKWSARFKTNDASLSP